MRLCSFFKHHKKTAILGFTLTEVMAVTAIVTSVEATTYVKAKNHATQVQCKGNLQQIGKMIKMYHMANGEYPDAEFYPKQPLKSDKSIVKVMKKGGQRVPKKMWVCPAAPEKIADKGLTFVYNDKFGGRRNLPHPAKAWLLIEVNCVSEKVPAPHPGGYNILFADGHVVTTDKLPKTITSPQEARIRQIRERLLR